MPKSPALVQITEPRHDVRIDMIYARADNFTGHVIYQHSFCFLHAEAEACLRRAVIAARQFGYRLKIFDAFRPQEAQQLLWDVLPVPGYVADPAIGSNHTRGVAIDLTLIDDQGRELDMGTPVDTMTAVSHHFHADLPQQVLVNRMYLMTVMLESGFVHHPFEWWHYQLPDAGRFALVSTADAQACMEQAGL
ncbi:MAG: D-alanyl-D-alanine dipeptidase [Comamonadaceae bacterium]|nr:MAG: D-alanyl-D-alanine dipeptidase [Comamonadaceae bacterium]